MKLELHKVKIDKIAFGEEFSVKGGVLTINKKAIIDHLMDDDRLASVDVELAHPGEKTRIMPVKDVVEPAARSRGPTRCSPA